MHDTAMVYNGRLKVKKFFYHCPSPVEAAQLKVEEERGRIKRKGRKTMPRKTYKPEEIVGILRDAEIKQGQGQRVANRNVT
jgi:hypothetical protein